MADDQRTYMDAFGRTIGLGDEVATITYKYHVPKRGIVVQLGKDQVKIRHNYGMNDSTWIRCSNAIKTRPKEEIEQN